jgi:hypothetical protein
MISYPKRNVTLPSVQGGFGSMVILKDPPKSITVPRRIKVGEDNRQLEWIDDSGDRICEMISKYARGVNQMVGVNYQNNGTLGGQNRYGVAGGFMANTQTSLPYKVVREGAFRPPIQPPQDLLPLSRLPRVFTHANSNISNQLIQKTAEQMACPTSASDHKGVANQILQVAIQPTQVYNIQPQVKVPKNLKQLNINTSSSMNVRTNESAVKFIPIVNATPERGINNLKQYVGVESNKSQNIQSVSLDKAVDTQGVIVNQKLLNAEAVCNKGGLAKYDYIHNDLVRQRTMPVWSAQTNNGLKIDLNDKIQSRHIKLPKKASFGSFGNGGTQPVVFNTNMPYSLTQKRVALPV